MASSSSNVVGVHYRVGKKIGEGSFGVIFEGTNLLNNQQVAIKFVRPTLLELALQKDALQRRSRRRLIQAYPPNSCLQLVLQEPRKSDAPQLRDEYRTYKILVGCREYPDLPSLGLGLTHSSWYPQCLLLRSGRPPQYSGH